MHLKDVARGASQLFLLEHSNDVYGLIVALGKSIVLIEGDDLYARKFFLQELKALIGRAVVGHYHLSNLLRSILHHRRQISANQAFLFAVPIEYDNCCS